MPMPAEMSEDELTKELQDVEDDLADLRRNAADLRRRIGEGEPGDAADKASALTAAEEQEDFIEQLEARQTSLQRRLAQQ
jgi:hypothetical protein